MSSHEGNGSDVLGGSTFPMRMCGNLQAIMSASGCQCRDAWLPALLDSHAQAVAWVSLDINSIRALPWPMPDVYVRRQVWLQGLLQQEAQACGAE